MPAARAATIVPDPEWIDIPMVVDPGLDGYRLDRFLSTRIARLSRTRIQSIIAGGQIRCAQDGRPMLRASARVRAGQRLVMARPAPVEPEVPLHYTLVHQDDGLLALDKPAGLPVHPTARYHRHTLTAVMRQRLGTDHGWQMAHRLDRETSGLMLFGRGGATGTAGALKRAFAQRRVDKLYLAVVHGTLTDKLRIDQPIGLRSDSRIRIKMHPLPRGRGGATAITEVEPVGYGSFRDAPVTWVKCRPLTGRQHQIRLHLALAGLGIVGDKLYGLDERHFLEVLERGRPMKDLESMLGIDRHALHAWRIAFEHPLHGQRCELTSPWPEDLADLISLPRAAPTPSSDPSCGS